MGHTRLGMLPKSRKWIAIIELVADEETEPRLSTKFVELSKPSQ